MLLSLKKVFLNPFYLKIYFIVITLLAEIPLISYIFVPIIKFGLIWALAILIYDLIFERRSLKAKNIGLMILFIIVYTVTIILNYETALKSTLLDYFYVIALFLVLYPVQKSPQIGDESKIKEIEILNYIIICMVTIMALVGLSMFAFQYKSTVFYNEIYQVGFVSNRLTGIFRIPTYQTCAIALICAICQLAILKSKQTGKARTITVLLIISIVINYLHISLAFARGIIIGLSVFIVVVLFFVFRDKLKMKSKVLKICTAGVIALMISAVFFCSFLLTRAAGLSIQKTLASEETETTNVGTENMEDIFSFDRDDIPDNYGAFTGRTNIWEVAIKDFSKNPLFGVGPYYYGSNDTIVESIGERLGSFQNVYVQALSANGALGFTALMMIFVLSVVLILKYLIKSSNLAKNYNLYTVMFGLLAFILTVNIIETSILYLQKNSGFVFWIYLGYLIAFVRDDRVSLFDKPVAALDNRITIWLGRNRKETK